MSDNEDKKERLLDTMVSTLPSSEFRSRRRQVSPMPVNTVDPEKSIDGALLHPAGEPNSLRDTTKPNYRSARKQAESLDPLIAASKEAEKGKRINVYLSADEHRALKMKSVSQDRSMNEVLRVMINRYLNDETDI